LPGMSGIECIRELKRRQSRLQIMMLTVFEDHDRIFQSLAAGASGYLLKQTPPGKLLDAIAELHRGGAPMSTQIARRVVDVFQQAAPSPLISCSASKRALFRPESRMMAIEPGRMVAWKLRSDPQTSRMDFLGSGARRVGTLLACELSFRTG
jgi:DNA-binding NarL/FixJ family response regulator